MEKWVTKTSVILQKKIILKHDVCHWHYKLFCMSSKWKLTLNLSNTDDSREMELFVNSVKKV